MHPNTPSQPSTKPGMSSMPTATSAQPSLHQESGIGTGSHATIGKSLVIKGEITGSESVYIDGRVEGSINLPEHCVTIGPDAEISATITALEVVVMGKITGNVNVSGRMEVRSEGSLIGDVVAERINVVDGAFFKGKIEIRKPGQRAEDMNPSSERNERGFPPVSADPPYQTM